MSDKPILFSGAQEIWLPIAGYEGRYEISNLGDVRYLRGRAQGRVGLMKPWRQGKGYLYVTLNSGGGQKKAHGVHRLVLETFVGRCPEGHQAAHNNGDPSDNRASNLRWATAKDNIADRSAHGRTVIGEDQASAKLDRHAVKTIKKMKGAFSAYETARLACVHPSTIQSIWDGETWKHV